MQTLMGCLLDAVAHMHAHGIVHRDLKLENLVFGRAGDLSTITIVDFGLAKAARARERLEGVTGTLWYTAPEVLKGVPYSPVVDLWSLGVVLYLVLTGARSLTTKGFHHKTPIRTSFDQRFNRYSQLCLPQSETQPLFPTMAPSIPRAHRCVLPAPPVCRAGELCKQLWRRLRTARRLRCRVLAGRGRTAACFSSNAFVVSYSPVVGALLRVSHQMPLLQVARRLWAGGWPPAVARRRRMLHASDPAVAVRMCRHVVVFCDDILSL